jgi:hypothetical protein
MEIRAADLTADHLGRRIKLDRTDDDRTFAIARIVGIRHKQIGDSDETETRLTLELVGDQRITMQLPHAQTSRLFRCQAARVFQWAQAVGSS